VLRNVVMSPSTTTQDFVSDMAQVFREILEEEIMVSLFAIVRILIVDMIVERTPPQRG
jgi:hypothetical protein